MDIRNLADGLSTVKDLYYNLCSKLDDGSTLGTRSRHPISNNIIPYDEECGLHPRKYGGDPLLLTWLNITLTPGMDK